MVCLKGNSMVYENLKNVIGKQRNVDINGVLVRVARSIGISFGD